ncbi:hypothetical protein JZ751_004165 [Albula glossodonta]|uniref:Lipoxygenase domain-containing protein n=1 Tax=Albula glossodonta TaxID=121402 RepID=A0A8T2P6F9_9TELE|nr:hypothetical protein JZ751_004165 [Albula glossodonta]
MEPGLVKLSAAETGAQARALLETGSNEKRTPAKVIFPGKDQAKSGNIYVVDYELLDGLPTGTIGGRPQYLAAPIVLLQDTQKELKPIAIQSLCLPDNLKHRGVENLANYHYKDDGMDIWDAIYKFVSEVVYEYYTDDSKIQTDKELKHLVSKIYDYGFLQKPDCPQTLKTREEAIKYITMIMFTCSAQHASVNNGQVPLGKYPEVVAFDKRMRGPIERFQKRLKEIEKKIEKRSTLKDFPYEYLHPAHMENSITI